MAKEVLLIDDNQDSVKYLSAVVEEHGYEAMAAYDGSEGLEKMRETKPDLIVLDIMMPRKTGLTLFKRVSEFVICALLVLASLLLYQKRRLFDIRVLRLMIASLAFTIGSELAFTFYISVYDLSNLAGHYLKIIAFFLAYRALVHIGLRQPYDVLFRDLKHERDKAQQYLDYVNLMTYDFYTSGDTAGHHSNLYPPEDYDKDRSAHKTFNIFVAAGVPAEKLVLGIPFYGRSWIMKSGEKHGIHMPVDSTIRGGGYTRIKEEISKRPGMVRYWDEKAQAPYLFNEETNQLLVYDDEESVGIKC